MDLNKILINSKTRHNKQKKYNTALLRGYAES